MPIASPAARRGSVSLRRPLQITVAAPERAAVRAASSLVIMPPRPWAVSEPPAARSISGVIRSTTSRSRGSGRPGSGGSL